MAWWWFQESPRLRRCGKYFAANGWLDVIFYVFFSDVLMDLCSCCHGLKQIYCCVFVLFVKLFHFVLFVFGAHASQSVWSFIGKVALFFWLWGMLLHFGIPKPFTVLHEKPKPSTVPYGMDKWRGSKNNSMNVLRSSLEMLPIEHQVSRQHHPASIKVYQQTCQSMTSANIIHSLKHIDTKKIIDYNIT